MKVSLFSAEDYSSSSEISRLAVNYNLHKQMHSAHLNSYCLRAHFMYAMVSRYKQNPPIDPGYISVKAIVQQAQQIFYLALLSILSKQKVKPEYMLPYVHTLIKLQLDNNVMETTALHQSGCYLCACIRDYYYSDCDAEAGSKSLLFLPL